MAKITLIGLGALGQVLTHKALERQIDIHAIVNHKQLSGVNFSLIDLNKARYEQRVGCNNEAAILGSSLIIITLKAFNILKVLSTLDNLIPSTIPIVMINNGMGIKEGMEQQFYSRKAQVFQAITSMAAFIKEDMTHWVSEGYTHYGPMFLDDSIADSSKINEGLMLFESLFINKHTGDVSVGRVKNIRPYQLEKLYLNAVINPLTVKYQCYNGELLTHMNELETLVDEIVLFDNALGFDGVQLKRDEFFLKLLNIIESTKNNRSSMLQDYLAARKLEIEEITGYLLNSAAKMGVNLDAHHKLYDLVKTLSIEL